ncbi:phosphinothricin acetyltransferase [Kineococcus radiotolerans]|uniref:Phosphinothricin acetyltransferase n=1 Tax=Kineococcus radiotolerans TaxID=131568 RepID=A0A7W4TPX2_KINRA|nr:GNAT family N-acetyltransferase [Kineococcus radiotolerans]MBB2902276.1 phosphinothricin acetyltransferase [Kineococcus radiotolerans]
MPDRVIRPATPADAAACAAVYAPYVRDTAISFELEPPDAAEVARRIEASGQRHAWLVLEDAGRVAGYAYASPFAARPAYDWSCEVSVYLAPGLRRSGAGRALYTELFARLEQRGFRTLVAGVTVPNEASLGLHRATGFEVVGTFRDIGFKLGRWWDVTRLQRSLGPGRDGAPEPLR